MKTRPIPPGIALQLLKLKVPMEHHGHLVVKMAEHGDWWAQHWVSCGLLRGILQSTVCHDGHKPGPDAVELSIDQVRELAESMGVVQADAS